VRNALFPPDTLNVSSPPECPPGYVQFEPRSVTCVDVFGDVMCVCECVCVFVCVCGCVCMCVCVFFCVCVCAIYVNVSSPPECPPGTFNLSRAVSLVMTSFGR